MTTYGKQIGSGSSESGFSSDVLLQLPNSATTPVSALELLTALSVTTPGSEASTFLTKLLNLGIAYNAHMLTPAGQTTDTATGTTTYKWTMNVAGAPVGEIQITSTGELILSGSLGAAGIGFRGAIGGTDLVRIGSSFGLEMRGGVAIQAGQGQNIALASTLACTAAAPNGGNTFVVTAGTGPVNLIAGSTFDFGVEINLFFNVAATLKHNQAPSGGGLQMQLAGSVDASMAIGGRIKFVYLNGQGFVELGRVAA